MCLIILVALILLVLLAPILAGSFGILVSVWFFLSHMWLVLAIAGFFIFGAIMNKRMAAKP